MPSSKTAKPQQNAEEKNKAFLILHSPRQPRHELLYKYTHKWLRIKLFIASTLPG